MLNVKFVNETLVIRGFESGGQVMFTAWKPLNEYGYDEKGRSYEKTTEIGGVHFGQIGRNRVPFEVFSKGVEAIVAAHEERKEEARAAIIAAFPEAAGSIREEEELFDAAIYLPVNKG